MLTVDDVVKSINYEDAKRIMEEFIEDIVERAHVKGVVVGVSGGIDSSVVYRLTVEALGPEKVHALVMPDTRTTPKEDINDALSIIKEYGSSYHVVSIDNIVDSYSILPFFDIKDRIPTGNLRARIRMTILYYYANKYGLLVLGTGDRSELFIGYYTKYGDGGVDALPIGSLLKTQVRKMAEHLGIPERIVKKPSSPRLWPGHMAEEELGMSYEEIDLVIHAILDKGIPPDKVPDETGVSSHIVERIIEMHRATRHKRTTPPIARLPWIKNPIIEI